MNYTEMLEFFVENGIALNKEQIEALKEDYLNEASVDPVKSDFNKFKKAWSFNNSAIVIKFEADCYDDEDMYSFGGYDVHDYPAFKKLKSDASRDELVQVVNNDFYAKFEKAIEKVNKVISGTIEIEGDWDTGNIVYHK